MQDQQIRSHSPFVIVAVKYKDLMLAKQKEYYQKNKEKIREKARIKRLNISEEGK